MADTARTKAQIEALFADNNTGQISAQDLRDFKETIMGSEFLYVGDFWKEPSVRYTTTDKTCRGWKDYSQVAGEALSFGNIVYLTTSGEWKKADVALSTKTGLIGLACDSYVSDATTCEILRKGVVYDSSFSAVFVSNYIGQPVYLASGVAGSITITVTTQSQLIVGWIEGSTALEMAIGKYRFDPEWAIRGA